MTASVRLAAFIFPQYTNIMQRDEMDFGSLGEGKRAIFCITPVNDGSMNYLVSMLFTQCFQELYLRADERYDGRLPVPVRVIQDEWANVPQPDSYPKVLATCRNYNIGIDIIVQNIQSIKARYRDEYQSIIGNCDTLLFLGGGNEPESLEFMSKLLGKETISIRTRGQTRGRSGSSSINYQLTGRELMTPDEIRMLPTKDALLFIRGEKPVQDKKYDIKKHPNVRRTADGEAKSYIHNPLPVPDYCGRRHVPDGACLSQKLHGRVSGGRGDRAGLHRVLGFCRQRYGGAGRQLGSHAGVGLSRRGHLQYAGAGGIGQGRRPRGAGDVWDVRKYRPILSC